MRECGVEHGDLVMFGLLRLSFGIGRLKRTKFVFVHLIGPRVSAVKRGQYNAVTSAMEKALKHYANTSLSLFDMTPEGLQLEVVINRVRKACVVDDANLEGDAGRTTIFTVEAFREALAREQAVTDEFYEDEAEKGDRTLVGSHSLKVLAEKQDSTNKWTAPSIRGTKRDVQEALRLVMVLKSRNWALFRPRLPNSGTAPTPSPAASSAPSTPQRPRSGQNGGGVVAKELFRRPEGTCGETTIKVVPPRRELKIPAAALECVRPKLVQQEQRMSLDEYMSLMTLAGL